MIDVLVVYKGSVGCTDRLRPAESSARTAGLWSPVSTNGAALLQLTRSLRRSPAVSAWCRRIARMRYRRAEPSSTRDCGS
jgi:hypothetical protein